MRRAVPWLAILAAGLLGCTPPSPPPSGTARPSQEIAPVADEVAALIATEVSKIGKPRGESATGLSVSLMIIGPEKLPAHWPAACERSLLVRRFHDQVQALADASGLRLTVKPPGVEADINFVYGFMPDKGDPEGVPLSRWRQAAKARAGAGATVLDQNLAAPDSGGLHYRSGVYATDEKGSDPTLISGEVLLGWSSWRGCLDDFATEIAAVYALGLSERIRGTPGYGEARGRLQVRAELAAGTAAVSVSNEMSDAEKVHLFCWEAVRRGQTSRTEADCARRSYGVLARER
jgi:hypothetical protein